jgi:hypothetical protein
MPAGFAGAPFICGTEQGVFSKEKVDVEIVPFNTAFEKEIAGLARFCSSSNPGLHGRHL